MNTRSHVNIRGVFPILLILSLFVIPATAGTENIQDMPSVYGAGLAHLGPGISLPVTFSLGSGEHPSPIGWRSPTGEANSPALPGADPFTVIDEKLTPAEAGALKSVIEETLHAFSYDAATSSWTARNYAGQVLFMYTKDGTALFSCGENSFGLSLLGVGRTGDLAPAGSGVAQATGRRLEIARAVYTEWYLNNNGGIEQGVTLADRPPGNGPLRVWFGLTRGGSLRLKDSQSLTVTDTEGRPLFEYTGLSAFSAGGKQLPAWLATEGAALYWVVDDAGAAYPVTIDPVVVPAAGATARFTGAAASDSFGKSVALSSNGTRALVGAPGNDNGGMGGNGAAYIFEMPAEGWGSITSATAANATFTGAAENDNFGYPVTFSSDGMRVLVGAANNDTGGDNAGAAYLFEMPAEGWGSITSATAANSTFTGTSASEKFGYSVSLSANGSRVLIGAIKDTSRSGAAYFFEMPAEGWNGCTSASAANATFTGKANNDYFGNSVSLSGNGTRALVGMYLGEFPADSYRGAVYLFEMPPGGWNRAVMPYSSANTTFTGSSNDRLGVSVSLSSEGDLVLAGASGNSTGGSGAGAVYFFKEPSHGVWSGTTTIPASAADATFFGAGAGGQFGWSVSLSGNKRQALVGAFLSNSFKGGAYLFEAPGCVWSGTTYASAANATFTGGAANDQFGYSVALSFDGSRALIGAMGNSSSRGAAYIFQQPYATLTAGGNTIGQAGTVVNGLTLNPTGVLTNVDLYLGISRTTVSGSAVKTGITLPISTATTLDGVDLAGKSDGIYYLIVTDAGTTTVLGATGSAVYTIEAPPSPTASFTGTPTSGNIPLTVTFSDTSTGDSITGRVWDFGDGNASWSTALTSFTHQYTTAGTFSVNLTVTNVSGSDSSLRSNYITVNQVPTASFTGTPTFGNVPLTVTFSDTSTGDSIIGRVWDFGDGNSSWSTALTSFTHQYTTAGTFSVNLTVTNASGSNSSLRINYITVNQVPTASFTGTPTSGNVPLTVTFSDTSTGGSIIGRVWDFGDGNASWSTALTSFTHLYSTTGTFSVNLTVTNASGSDSLLRPGYITVSAPPSPDPGPGPGPGPSPGVNGIGHSTGSPGSSFSMTVTGSNFMFGASPTVTFTYGGTTGGKTVTKSFKATHVKVITSSKLTCHVKVPSDAKMGSYTVTVKNGDGQVGSLKNAFTVTHPIPLITSLTLDKGVAGKTVTITNLAGRNFSQNAKVFLKKEGSHGIVARNVKVVSPRKITCLFMLPIGTAKGKWDIVVKNPDGKAGEKEGAFTVR
ncbi:MAG: PKD domain-containing protein [Methanomicrobiales archaeon]|nr:PKD domain-containing protein [Methanomicrobiales archaeon]